LDSGKLHINFGSDNVEQLKNSIADGCMGVGNILGGQHVLEDVGGNKKTFSGGGCKALSLNGFRDFHRMITLMVINQHIWK
jgi:hypothetical protein